jgi:putative tryptophan/tyrosine transport system substrate-binding protein
VRRREFITFLGGVAATWPVAARAQQPVIGYFSGRSPKKEAPLLIAFRQGLEEANYTVGKNVAVEFRFSDGQDDRRPALAADLFSRKVVVLVTRQAVGIGGKGSNRNYPRGVCVWRRSGRGGYCRQPQPTKRKFDRRRASRP